MNLKDFSALTLLNEEGKPIHLAEYVGRRVLIFVFPRADTPGCTTQACGFRDAFPQITENHTVVFGLSSDPPSALARWKKKQNLPYTLLSDPTHALIEILGAWGERSLYGRKFMGIIRSHFIFDEAGDLAVSQVKVSPADSIREGVKRLIEEG
ncbi:MAG TPA: peroxiredoxin [Aggregatilineales bacterium]|nr:peroxiredoxin [Anaerolineales bacterium]HRE47911.1 peroxiredoxin [Aggregatilineales bacterium]